MIYKRGKGVYWYEFVFKGKRIRESTNQTNPRVARQIEAARKTQLAKGEVGIKDRIGAPKLKTYAESWLGNYVKIHCKYATHGLYKQVIEQHIRPTLGTKRLDEITREDIKNLIAKKVRKIVTKKKARRPRS